MTPKDWHHTVLSNVVAAMESGSRPKGGVSNDSGEVLSLGGENILQSGGVSLAQVKRVPLSFFERMTKGHLKIGDVLINKDGAQTGKVGLYTSDDGLACINEHLFLIRGDNYKITQEYLYYLLLSQEGQRQIAAQISGSAQPGLKSNFLRGVNTGIPDSTVEQSKITELLAQIERAIQETEAVIAKQERIKTGLMQTLLEDGIDSHGQIRSKKTHAYQNTILGEIPTEWEVKSLSQLTTKIVDGVHHTPTYVDSGVPFIVITNLTNTREVDFANTRFVSAKDHETFSKRADPKPGDVLVTKDGTLGTARIVPDDAPEFSIFVSVALLKPRITLALPELIWSFFESGEFLRQLGTQSAGTGLSHIHLEHFRAFQLRRPPIDEQKRIFRVIAEQERLLALVTSDLRKLNKLKTALMQDLLTGKKRVTALLDQELRREKLHA